MRAERLLRIVVLLQSRGRATAGELARELGVTARTIQRDMVALSVAGIPVYATRGGGGGWALLPGYRSGLTGLTASDAFAILVGRPAGVLSGLGLDDPGEAPMRKVMAAIAPDARDRAEHARQRIHVDLTPWGPAGEPDPTLALLQRSIFDDHLVLARYGASRTRLRLEPLGLVCKGTVWYLVARRDGRYRTYRVSRMHEVVLTGEPFQRPAGFDLAAQWRAASVEYQQGFPSFVVTLRLRGDAVARAAWVSALKRRVGEPDADGWTPAVLDTQDEENALAAVRQLGDEVVVLAPESLREKAVRLAREFVSANT